MASREQLEAVKRATVALALVPETPPEDASQTPFVIVGSGFCIEPEGVVVTCEHVMTAFIHQDIRQVIADVSEEDRGGDVWPLKGIQMLRPHVLFYQADPEELLVSLVPVTWMMGKTNYDLGLVRIDSHTLFPDGYPYLEVEDYSNVYEGMEVATCGFPMGNRLHEQLGTKTSSFDCYCHV